jgi:hypothetical protein
VKPFTRKLHVLDFSQCVGRIVRDCGMSPHDVTLKTTESQAMPSSIAPSDSSLARLQLQRLQLSPGDFEKHHSLLAQFRDVPFDPLPGRMVL